MAVGRCCIRIWERGEDSWAWQVNANGHWGEISHSHPDRANATRSAQALVKGIVREISSAKVKFAILREADGSYTLKWAAAW